MKTQSLFEKTLPVFEVTFTDEVNTSYITKHPALDTYSKKFDHLLLLPFLQNTYLKNELFIKETAIKLELKKEKLKYKQDLIKLKQITEKEIKSILYSKKYTHENKLQIFLNQQFIPVAVYRKKPQQQATILTIKKHPEKMALIEFIFHKLTYEVNCTPEEKVKKLSDIIDKITHQKTNLITILKDFTQELAITSEFFKSSTTAYVIYINNNEIKIETDPIKQYYYQECDDFCFSLEEVPEHIPSLKEELKILKMHIKNILKRNNTNSINDLPEEDKEDLIYSYNKFKKLKNKIKLEKLKVK